METKEDFIQSSRKAFSSEEDNYGVYREDIYKMLLIKALNDGKKTGARYLTFFNDEESQNAALELGFQCVGRYVCYLKKL